MTAQHPEDEIQNLPETALRGIQALRRSGLSGSARRQLSTALDRLEQSARAPATRSAEPTGATWLFVAAPTCALALIVVHLTLSADQPDRRSQVQVLVPEIGHGWADLELLLHHHAADTARIELHAPLAVHVEGASGRNCIDARCIHTFDHPTRDVPLRVGVDSPGDYEIHVNHASDSRSVREMVTLRAR